MKHRRSLTKPRRACGTALAIIALISLMLVASCQKDSSGECAERMTSCDGRCTALLIDPDNCGACGNRCRLSEDCIGGSCTLLCPDDRLSCSGSCIDPLTDEKHCGGCGNECPADHLCFESECLLQCGDGLTKCSPTECVDVLTDVNHCGQCKNECEKLPNAVSGCGQGACGIGKCDEGWGNCDATGFNGCETELTENENHCGGCNKFCPDKATCIASTCFDQAKSLYSKQFGSTGSDLSRAIAIDSSGDILIAGEFEETVDFGGGGLSSQGADDIFLLRLDNNGNHLWSRNYGSTGDDDVRNMAIDSQGNAILCGFFTGDLNVDGQILTASGTDMLVLKIDASGSKAWAKSFGGSSDDRCRGVVVDAQDNIYVAGAFSGTVDFDGTTVNSNGGLDAVVMKLDSAGTVMRVATFGGSSTDRFFDLSLIPSGGLYAAGRLTGTVTIGDTTHNAQGSGDVLVVKLDDAGQPVWSQSFGGSSLDRAERIVTLANEDPFLGGKFAGSAMFGDTTLTESAGGDAAWVGRLEQVDGQPVFATAFTGPGNQIINDIHANALDRIVVVGSLSGTMSLGTTTLETLGSNDGFLAKLDAGASPIWSKTHGNSGNDSTRAVAFGPSGFIYATGSFQDTISVGISDLMSAGSTDIFLVKYAP